MKTGVQYLNDHKGNTQAVQLPITQWTRLMNRLSKYEQMLKLKTDLSQSFEEVKKNTPRENQKAISSRFFE